MNGHSAAAKNVSGWITLLLFRLESRAYTLWINKCMLYPPPYIRSLPHSRFYCHFVFFCEVCIHVIGAWPSLLCYVHTSERTRIVIWLVEMMRAFCHHVLTNQMTLYICSDTCTQSNKNGIWLIIQNGEINENVRYICTTFKTSNPCHFLIRQGI